MSILKNTLLRYLINEGIDIFESKNVQVYTSEDSCAIHNGSFDAKIFRVTVQSMRHEMRNFISCNELTINCIDDALDALKLVAPMYDVSPFGVGSDDANDLNFTYIGHNLYCMYYMYHSI